MIGEVAALSAAFCWALSAVLYRNVLQRTGYLAANLVRSAFAALFLVLTLPFVYYQSSVLSQGEYAILAIGAVASLVVGDTFYFVGLKKVGVCRAQPISGAYPLYVMLFAAVMLGEPLTPIVLIGTPLIVLGIVLISMSKSDDNCNSRSSSRVQGLTASLAAAIFWSVGLICYKLALLDHQTLDLTFSIFVTAFRTAVVLPFLLVLVMAGHESKQVTRLSGRSVATLAAAGIVALGIGGILLFTSYSLINANIATPLSSISPLFSVGLAKHYSGESTPARIISGAILIVIGVVLVTFLA